MNWKWLGKWISMVGLVSVAGWLLSLSSCGHSQELVGIQIQPASETFGASDIPVMANAGSQVQLKALGSYVHPPVTKDITDQVTWFSNTPQMFTVNSTGLLTATGASCGATLVSATVNTNADSEGLSASGAIIVGYMTANVVCFSGSGTGSGPALGVTFAGAGSGTVASSPTGLSCASSAGSCSANFPSGTVVTMTATPTSPSTFGSWLNCDSPPSTNPCSVTVEESIFLTVTFN